MKRLSLIIFLLSLPVCSAGWARAQGEVAEGGGFERGLLRDIKDKRSAMLLVVRSLSVDARDPSKVSAEDVRRALAETRPRMHTHAYRIIGTILNKYIRKYESMTSVETRAEAQFLIVFKIMQERHSLVTNQSYSYGKLFVLVPGAQEEDRPRVVWESKGEMTLAEDAAEELIKALKALRGEK